MEIKPEEIIEVFKAMEIEFNSDDTMHELHVVGGMFTQERLDAIGQEMKNDPELNKQFDAVIEEKREKWRTREADRKLVG